MDFKRLRTFRTAAQFLNFSEASNHLGYVQSAVTTQIRSLEEELGTQLFTRNGRGVALTAAGQKLQEYSERLFSLRNEAQDAINGVHEQTQKLRIAGYETILTYLLPNIIHQFNQRFPKSQLFVQPIGVKQLKQIVSSEMVDLAFVFDDAAATTKQYMAGLEHRHFGKEDIIVIAPPEHELCNLDSVYAKDLTGETLLLTEQGCYYRNQFESALIRAGALTGTLLEFTSIEAIKACVKIGTGIAAISKVSVEKELASGEVVELSWKDKPLSADVALVWKNKEQSHIVQEFMKMVDL
jgi:DNA-binding transcriptional LysR family regulator